LPHIINAMNITHLHSTPSLLSGMGPGQVPKLECIMASGEPVRAKVHLDWAGMGVFSGMQSGPGTI
jgi:hypothetical protein